LGVQTDPPRLQAGRQEMIEVRADQMIYRLLPWVWMRLRSKGDAASTGN